MAIRYYPASKIKKGKTTNGNEFLLNGNPYTGKYYQTYDNRYFTGANPMEGKNQELLKNPTYTDAVYLNTGAFTNTFKKQFANQTNLTNSSTSIGLSLAGTPNFKGEPSSYFPIAIESDYEKGYIIRYFTKKVNTPGYVKEISQIEYASIKNGAVPYDVSMYQILDIFWKITGPLNQKRVSQYDIRAGIVDTNKRLVENANKTFLGITDFIGGDYTKFARPTE
jgi:hypothetical protein